LITQLGIWAGKILDWLGVQIPIVVAKLAQWGAAFVQWLTDSLPGMGAQLAIWWEAMLAWLTDRLPLIMAQLQLWGSEFVEWARVAVPPLLVALGDLAGQLLTWLGNQLPGIVSMLALWGRDFGVWVLTDAIPALIGSLGELGLQFMNWFISMGPTLADMAGSLGVQIISGIGMGILESMSQLGAIFGLITQSVSLALGSVISAGKDAGLNLVFGLWNGIAEAWTGFIRDVGNLFSGMIGWIRQLLGIRSPSTIMMNMGGMLTDGMAIGIENGTKDVLEAAKGMATAMTIPISEVATQPPGSSGGGTTNTTNTTNNFVQHVQSSAPTDQTIANFGLLAAMANGAVSGV
jgi:hypothetical protein